MKRKGICLILTVLLLLTSFTLSFADDSYTVKSGDVLWKIAQNFGLTWEQLAEINNLENPHMIFPGQVLSITDKQEEVPAPSEAIEETVDDAVEDTEASKVFDTVDVKIANREIEVPAVFTYPLVEEDVKYPLVVMAHGHGGSKDEAGGYTKVSEALAAVGIASIRMDFPGCGESTEPFTENNLTNMLSDVNASLEYVLANYDVDADKIGILGYSMGGRIAILSAEQDTRYKVMTLWSPVGTNGPASMIDFMGGQEAYDAMNATADEEGFVTFTTRWGQNQDLGKQWFADMNAAQTLDSIATFEGPLLVIHGDKDDVIYPEVSKAVAEAAQNSTEVVVHEVVGADHGFGIFSNETELTNDTVNTTVDFFESHLK